MIGLDYNIIITFVNAVVVFHVVFHITYSDNNV
jgi:hypothetical protein